MKSKTQGKVSLVGAGPGDPGLITLRGARALAQADVVIYDRLVNPELFYLCPQAQKIYCGKELKGESEKLQAKINQLLIGFAKKGFQVVRLKGGDPFVFGRAGEEVTQLKKHKIAYEIIPGITAGYAAPAYAGIPVTDRRYASMVSFVTAHEGDHKKKQLDYKALAGIPGTLVFFMGVQKLPEVIQKLVREGKPEATPISIIEWGTLPRQRVIEGTLATIVPKIRKQKVVSPSLAVIGDVNRLRKDLAWFPAKRYGGSAANFGGEKKPLFGKTVLVTRARAQAGILRRSLEEMGACVIEFPTIEILPPKNWQPVDRAIQNLSGFDWIVFTSTNGVQSFMSRLKFSGKDARAFSHLKIAAIGESTEVLLSNFGLRADLVPGRFTSEALVAEFQKRRDVRGKKFLLPRTDIAPEYLHKELERLGASVTEVIAYQTKPNRRAGSELKDRLRENKIDYALFTSSSTVQNFFEILPKTVSQKLKTRYISIGPVTSQTLRYFGKRPYREATEHTISGLIQALLVRDGPKSTGSRK